MIEPDLIKNMWKIFLYWILKVQYLNNIKNTTSSLEEFKIFKYFSLIFFLLHILYLNVSFVKYFEWIFHDVPFAMCQHIH